CHRLLAHAQRREPLEHRALVLFGEPALKLAGVDQFPVLLAAEVEAIEAAIRLRPADDCERITVAAGGFYPGAGAAGDVTSVTYFRYDAFEFERTSAFPDCRAVT